jgi:peptide/nickel transport system permease protein
LSAPLPQQFVKWLWRVLHDNFGHSLITGQSTTSVIGGKLDPTAELVVMAFVMALVIGIPLGVLSAQRKGRLSELAVRIFVLLGISVPSFLAGSLLIVIIAALAPGIRLIGYVPLAADPLRSLAIMFWPALTLALTVIAIVVRYTRVAMVEAMAEEYTLTGRAMGLRYRTVVYRNAMRNALVPVVGAVSAQIAYLIGGVVVIEQVFYIPGLGSLTLNAVNQRDYPILQAVVLLVATAVIVVNLLTDVLLRVLDPRLRDA